METNTLRPGLLVSLKTSIEGNVKYRKRELEKAHVVEGGVEKAKWETTRTIHDPIEHDRAVKARAKIRNTVTAVCAVSAFGLLCPESSVNELDTAVGKGREIAEEFNETAKVSKINFHIITGRIAPDDAEAIRAIRSEVADLIGDMTEGLKKLDVKAVREAANKARGVATMLSDAGAEKVNQAIADARAAARKLVKAGDAAAVALDYALIQNLADARTAFLDVETDTAEVVAPEAEAHAVEFDGFNAAEIDAAEEKVAPELTPEEKSENERIITELNELPDLELAERE